MTKTLRALAVVALAAAVLGIGGACQSPDKPASGNTEVAGDMAVKYAQCMRERGVQVSDPKPGQPLRIEGGPQDAAKIQAAQEACKQYAPQQDAAGAQSGDDLDRQAKLVQCLREHGVTVADPQPGQPLRIEGRKDNEQETQKAMDDCQREVGAPSPPQAG